VIRVFVAPQAIDGGRLRLEGADAQHIGAALRVRPGEELVAVTPDGVEHLCRVQTADGRVVDAEVLRSEPSAREPSIHIRLGLALLKGDQLDRILEYAGEVGVTSVQPLLAERAVARLDPEKAARRVERWRQILRQGAALGQRGRVPDLLPPAAVADSVSTARAEGLTPHLLYEGTGLPSLSSVELGSGVCLLVGPEGGWADAEVRLAESAGATAVTLGPRIMRPLPAALMAVAVVLHRGGELELKEG
jgi:16S rRNA (uracil1498-N3)-methyltransferase